MHIKHLKSSCQIIFLIWTSFLFIKCVPFIPKIWEEIHIDDLGSLILQEEGKKTWWSQGAITIEDEKKKYLVATKCTYF